MSRRLLLVLIPLALLLGVVLYKAQVGSANVGIRPAGAEDSITPAAEGAGELLDDRAQPTLRTTTSQANPQEAQPESESMPELNRPLLGRFLGVDVQGNPAATAFIEFARSEGLESTAEQDQTTRVEAMSGAGDWSGELVPGETRVRLLPPRWTKGQGPGLWQTFDPEGAGPVELSLYLRYAQGTSILGAITDKEGKRLSEIEVVLRNLRTERDSVTASDDQGTFGFHGVAAGSYHVVLADGAEDDGSQMYLVNESVAPIYVQVEQSSPGVIHVRDLVLSIDPTRFRVFVHPPDGTDPATVTADVTTNMFASGYVMPLARSAEGIVVWAPMDGFDDDSEQRMRVTYQDASGRRVFRLQVHVKPGKTERVYIPK